MLDPLSAISLASAIVQFVDFSTKVIGGGSKLYQSSTGALEENIDLEKFAFGVKQWTESILEFQRRPEIGVTSANDEENDRLLKELAQSCQQVATDLLEILEDLKVRSPQGFHRKWESFQKVTKSQMPWNREKIQKLEKRLRLIQDQILHRVFFMLSGEQLRTGLILKKLENESSKALRVRIQDGIPELRATSKDQIKERLEISQNLDRLAKVTEAQKVRDVINSLDCSSRTLRLSGIQEAHKHTFKWVFDEQSMPRSENDLSTWLRHGGGIYWISGRPGSGKSTLVKYVAQHPSTEALLRIWAGKSRLVMGKYFLWNAGDLYQKSVIGLLRSLLYDILNSCPDLISKVCYDRVFSFGLSSTEWREDEILACLETLCKRSLPMSFCFFIDGLDEYDGDHIEAISTLRHLTKLPQIKICCSSRPWNIFKQNFARDYQLAIETVTEADIRAYVVAIFANDERFSSVSRNDARYEAFTSQIISDAHGVFLWVKLVSGELLRGIRNTDDITDLQRRLSFLPKTLEDLYERAFDRIDDFYKRDAAQYLRLLQHAVRPLPLATLFFEEIRDEYLKHSDEESRQLIVSDRDIEAKFAKWRNRIHASCQDFLHIFKPLSNRVRTGGVLNVDFHHVTTIAFLETTRVRTRLKAISGEDFNPRLNLMKGLLAHMQMLPSLEGQLSNISQKETVVFVMICEFLQYAWDLELSEQMSDIALLEAFETVSMQHVHPHTPDSTTSLSKFSRFAEDYEVQGSDYVRIMQNGGSFFEFAVCLDYQVYVDELLNKQPLLLKRKSNRTLLLKALRALDRRVIAAPQRDPLGVIRKLLKHGASPCERVCLDEHLNGRRLSILQVYLRELRESKTASSTLQFQALVLLLESCMKMSTFDSWLVPIGDDCCPRRLTVLDVVHTTFERYGATNLEAVIKSSKWYGTRHLTADDKIVLFIQRTVLTLGDILYWSPHFVPLTVHKGFDALMDADPEAAMFMAHVATLGSIFLIAYLVLALGSLFMPFEIVLNTLIWMSTIVINCFLGWYVFSERMKKMRSFVAHPYIHKDYRRALPRQFFGSAD